jgi:hypothetical protein
MLSNMMGLAKSSAETKRKKSMNFGGGISPSESAVSLDTLDENGADVSYEQYSGIAAINASMDVSAENTPYGSRTPSLVKKARGSPLRDLDNSMLSIDDTAIFDTLDIP